jgi:cytochrome c-type biogenesis protein CcmF
MLAEIGSILNGLALAATLYAAFAVYWSIRRDDARWATSGRNAVYAAAALLGLAVLALLAAFLDDQFYIQYVAQHSSRALPLYLKASAVWGGQAGSLLLWSFLQALFAALLVWRPPDQAKALIPWATIFLSLITVFFTAMTLFLSNPFTKAATIPADGQGLNPLLRHPGMIFHPPAMYLGYVGLAVPFALALAALVVRRVDDWPAVARRWTLAAWLFLGLGLLLGMRWAYDVLGWGGYWGWDPVENAGLMPWFTATALLHGLVMQERGRGFRWWNALLVLLSFVLVLFGTFTTRSGLIQSVHAFARSNLGLYFLAAIAVTLVGSLALFFSRRSLLTDDSSTDELFSREGMFILTLILFLTLTGSVFVGSTLPTLTGGTFEAPPAWFDRVTGPQFAALVLVMGVCPLLGRAVNALRQLERRGFSALLGGVLVTGIAALVGFTRPASLIGFAVVGLAGGTALGEISRGLAARVRKGEGPLQALWRLFGQNRRRYGGYLVHLGIILMAVGVIGTRFYPFETEIVMAPGESVGVGDYTLVFEDLRQEPASDYVSTHASLAVYRGDKQLRTLTPQLNNYQNFHQTIAVPSVRAGVREDLYLILAGWSDGGTSATFKVFINPLAMFLWLGGLVFMAGGAVALWPSVRGARLSAPQARRRRAWSALGLAVGLSLLALAVWAMWGTGQGTAASAPEPTSSARLAEPQQARVREGQSAPGFTLDLLDDSTLSLSDLQGQVAVLNFWATWCPPCEDELPDFQSVWEEYRQRDVVFVGLAIQEEAPEVEEMLSQFGVTYPVGLDPDQSIALDYGITGVPETFVVDPEGNVAYVHVGPVNGETLRGELEELLAQ